jgi:hypothetical protein
MGLTMALLFTMTFASTALAAEPTNPFDLQLSKEAASLVTSAIKSPYGWGWTESEREPKTAPSRGAVKPVQTPRRSEIDVRQTAATGLLLFLAGERLNDPSLTKAATEAARALAAVQQPSGQLPALGMLAAGAGGHDEPAVVPARAATCAAIGLFCAVLQGTDKPDPRFISALTKAASWLSAQQTPAGAFAVAYPPDAGKDATRVVRLDTPDYRDATAALLLAARVLGEPAASHRADEAVRALLAMRIRSGDERAATVWLSGYRLTGDPLQNKADFPYALDSAAANYSMQTLFIACLLSEHWNDRTAADALIAASKSVEVLPRRPNGSWHAHYHLLTRKPLDAEPTNGTGSAGPSPFDRAADSTGRPDAGMLPKMIECANAIAAEGTEPFLSRAFSEKGDLWPPYRIAMMLCGLGSDRLATSLPRSAAEARQYMEDQGAAWDVIDGSAPRELETRSRRVQLLLVRAALEDVK